MVEYHRTRWGPRLFAAPCEEEGAEVGWVPRDEGGTQVIAVSREDERDEVSGVLRDE